MRTAIGIVIAGMAVISCARQSYPTNGETIYRNGKNLQGQSLLDKEHSSIRIFKSCQGCHGKSGDRLKSCNIKWSSLSDPAKIEVPYTDSLFARFLDQDIKSDGTAAQTGVHWKMTEQEKKDLIAFLKVL